MHESGRISITVGIPAYGRTDYLVEAVESAVAQTAPASEIIISQNKHPEPAVDAAVLETIEALVDRFPFIRVNRNTTRCNLSTNINSIVEMATGEYITFIGDDDRLKPVFLEQISREIGDTDVVFADHHIIDDAGCLDAEVSETNSRAFGRRDLQSGMLDAEAAKLAAWRRSIPIFAAVTKTAVLREMPLVDDLQGADTEFFIRLAESGGQFAFIDEPLTEIRYHGGNIRKTAAQYARLVEKLSSVKTDGASRQLQRSVVSTYTFVTVKKYLIDGRIAEARTFLKEYGSNPAGPCRTRILFQRLCLLLPGPLASRVYGVAMSAWNSLSFRSEQLPA